MRNLHLIAVAIIMSLLFTSCESDTILEDFDTTTSSSSESQTPPKPVDGEITINSEMLQTDTDSELENRSRLIYSRDFSMNAGEWEMISLYRDGMADPMSEKYRVVMTPYAGNPDLYIHGYAGRQANVWREIRRGTGSPVEETSFRKTDLMTNDRDETELFTNIYAWTAAHFLIQIYVVDVDCKEYPSAEQITTLEWNPVCGCDGIQYSNPSAAQVSGVTSYTFGSCGDNCDYSLGLGFAAICDDFESYNTGLDFAPQSYDWEVWPGGSDAQLIELAGGGPGFGGYTEKYLQFRKYGAIRSDVLLKLHGHNEEIHRMAWKMRVNNGNNAYFSVQRQEVAGDEHGEEFYFYSNGSARIVYQGYEILNFNFPQNIWFDVELIVDLDTKIYTFVVNGVPVRAWRNPYGTNELWAIDFYANGNNPQFDIDDVCYEEGLSHNPYGSTANAGNTMQPTEVKLDGGFNPKHKKAQYNLPNM